MRYLFLLFLVSSLPTFGQQHRLLSGYVTFQYTHTLKDVTKGNNPWGMGTGLQIFFNINQWFRPAVDLTSDLYLENDKTLRVAANGEHFEQVTTISKILAGPSLQLGTYANVGFVAGAAFVNREALLAIKPSLTIFPTKRQTVFFKGSHITVFNRGNVIKENFVSWSVGVGLKVF
jgi:hypothetical protein